MDISAAPSDGGSERVTDEETDRQPLQPASVVARSSAGGFGGDQEHAGVCEQLPSGGRQRDLPGVAL
jgi:hypothetical protein